MQDILNHYDFIMLPTSQTLNGSSKAGCVGDHDFVKTLKSIQEDSSIKALVLRINSPGGDALASDIISGRR
ncbi:unnamed protein product [Larinioides sclopetarius]|uniref:Uncharacterized protein n=1 Tax=Larinioides sclopetarius TaxID=280406 RepID=A0AAV1ZZ20_9ARAC